MRLPDVGEVVAGKYSLDSVLGEGGFARVYAATRLDTGRRVAIKFLKPRQHGYEPAHAERFRRELRVIAGLQCPSTLTLFDFGRTDAGVLFMVLEYVDGQDLSDAIDRLGTFREKHTVHVVRQVLESLREAHTAGLLHRDIKPSNIRLFEYAGDPLRVKVLDFGLAKSLTREEAALTADGKVMGTPRFMSPEQMRGEELTPASDLFSLGLVAYEMLLGTSVSRSRRTALDRAVFISAADPVSPELRTFVNTLLAAAPAERFPSAAAALDAIPRLPRAGPSAADPQDTIEDAHTIETAPAPPPQAPPRPRRPVPTDDPPPQARTRVPPTTALAALALAVLPAAAFWLTRVPTPDLIRTAPAVPAGRANPLAPPADAGAPTQSDAGTHRPPEDGCGQDPPFRGAGSFTTIDGLRPLRWDGFIPTDYDPERRHPLIVLFHQDLQHPREIMRQSDFTVIAQDHHAIVIAPEGDGMLPWRQRAQVAHVPPLVAETALAVCIDPDRIYLVGHGAGAIGAEHLACEPWVAGAAFVSYRTSVGALHCTGRAVPSIYLGTTRGTRMPLHGGVGCAGVHRISLTAHENLWRVRNQCADQRTTWLTEKEGTCHTWDCETPFVSCHLDGGHGWPGPPTEEIDPANCDPPQANFPAAATIWRFFESTRAAPHP